MDTIKVAGNHRGNACDAWNPWDGWNAWELNRGVSRDVILTMIREGDGVMVSVGLAAAGDGMQEASSPDPIRITVFLIGVGIVFDDQDTGPTTVQLVLTGHVATEVHRVRARISARSAEAGRKVVAVFFHGTRCSGSATTEMDG